MRRLLFAAVVAALVAGSIVAAQPGGCSGCVPVQYWQVDPDFYRAPDLASFPERAPGVTLPGVDLGVGFSGGGTRSMSATLGQWRGLLHNGWLERVRYVGAVSGGSWSSAPLTYYNGDLGDMVGPYDVLPTLTPATADMPIGSLADAIAHSGLAATGLAEVPQWLPDRVSDEDLTHLRHTLINVRDLIRKVRGQSLPDPSRRDKTYAHMIGQMFIAPFASGGIASPYSWHLTDAMRITSVSGQAQTGFEKVPDGRPFLIAGGTIVWMRPGFSYPRLIPIEYTPLYTGVRQRFGALGGTYVMPWAYDRTNVVADPRQPGRLLVDPATVRMFTLADMVASSGAAPQLMLMLGAGAPERVRSVLEGVADAFPWFRPLAVRDGKPVAPDGVMAHGDGGFTDNYGLMPLLARQVKHIIVFVNSNSPYGTNAQLQSYFYALDDRGGTGDKSMNAVFPPQQYGDLIQGLDRATGAGGAAVHCQTTNVLGSELYNIAAYDGLKICWVYNHAATNWKRALDPAIQAWLTPHTKAAAGAAEARQLSNFPFYATFEENKPAVIKLTGLQVNLLADLSAWAISKDGAGGKIAAYFGPDILPPPR